MRRRPLTPAAAMPHATLAWPQARPRGPCDAQPRAYHGPSDFRLWAPVGRTAHAGNARLLGLPRLAAHAAAAAAAALRSVLGREPPRASKTRDPGLRPALNKQTELRLYIIYISKRILTYQVHSPRCDPSSRLSHSVCDRAYRPRRPPTACDCACRSLITCIAPRPRVSTQNIPTPFDTLSASPATTSPAPRARLPPYGYMHRFRRSLTTCIALRPRATVALLAAVTLALRPDSLAPHASAALATASLTNRRAGPRPSHPTAL